MPPAALLRRGGFITLKMQRCHIAHLAPKVQKRILKDMSMSRRRRNHPTIPPKAASSPDFKKVDKSHTQELGEKPKKRAARYRTALSFLINGKT